MFPASFYCPFTPAAYNRLDPALGRVESAAEAAPGAATATAASASVAASDLIVEQSADALSIPNEIWGEIASFSTRSDILNLRATHRQFTNEVETAVRSLRLRGNQHIRAFAYATDFRHVRALKLHDVDNATLKILATRLATYQSDILGLSLLSTCGSVADALTHIARLPLRALLLADCDYRLNHGLSALSSVSFAVELAGSLTRNALAAASRISTLTILCNDSLWFDDSIATYFAGHPKLQHLALHANRQLTSRGIAALAAMPALEDFVLYHTDRMSLPLDALALGAMADNRAIQHLYIETGEQSLSEEAFQALSRSETLATLRLAICPGMHAVAHIRSLRSLHLSSHGPDGPPIDRTLATAILSLPLLTRLTLESTHFKDDAFVTLLAQCRASHLHISKVRVTPGAVAALLSNSHVRTVRLEQAGLSPDDIETLAHHPTISHLLLDGKSVR